MAYDIGPRIGIDGEREFNNQISQINGKLRECGSEMKALSSEFENNANSQDALIAKNKALQKELGLQEQKMSLLKSQYEKQTAKLKELADAYQKAKDENGEMSAEATKAENAFNRQTETVTKLSVSINETQNFMNKINNTMNQNSAMLSEIAAGTRDAATGYSELDNASKKAGENLDDVNKKIDAGNLMDAADTISGIGDKIIDFGEKAAGAFTDLEGVTTRVNTYFGLTGDAAEQMGNVVENVFRTGVTDSLDEVGNAVITVNNNLKDLDPGSLETITNQAINLEQVFGSDMNESMRGVNALMTNFGLDAQTAMDYLVKGTQNGLDKTQELGDNLSEYSGKFSQAGYSAEEYFQLLQNGLEGGAYNLDKVNDSINEVTTRLSDGTIAESLGSFSQKTQETFAAWQQGGATQKDVINSIVEDIANCTNQQDQLNLAATAFGTLGEDANIGVIESLTTLGDSYSNVSGAAQQMADDATTPMQTLQAAINELQLALAPLGEKLVRLATEYLPPIVNGIISLVEGFLNLPGPVQTVIGVIAGVLAALSALAPVISAIMAIVGAIGTGVLLPLIGIIAGVVAAITAAILIFQNWGSITQWLSDTWQSVKETLSQTWDSILQKASEIWESMKTFVTETVENMRQAISEKWENIKESVSQTAEMLKQSVIQTWENIKTGVSEAVDYIKNFAVSTWETAKNSVVNTVTELKNKISEAWNMMKQTISNAMNVIRSTIENVWNGIRSTVSNVANGIASVISSVFSKIVNTVTTVMNTVKNMIINGFNAITSGVSSATGALANVIMNVMSRIRSIISNLISNAFSWGSDFINGLKNGIMSGVNAIVNAVKRVANSIKSFLHFSRPDEGPLRDYETWMPDMIDGMVKGIDSNIYKIRSAAKRIAQVTDNNMQQNLPKMIQSASVTKETVLVVGGDTLTIDGRVVGKTAERYITITQSGRMAAKGRRK